MPMITYLMENYEEKVERVLGLIPGLLTWTILLAPIWLGIVYPQAIIYMLAFITLYWCYMAFKNSMGIILGYPKYQEEIKADWLGKISELDYENLPDRETLPDSVEQIIHFVVIPVVNESEEILRGPIEALYNQDFPTEQVCLVYSIEEKYGEEVEKSIKNILGDREKEFFRVFIFRHPAGIEGEAKGSGGGNRKWGASHAVEELRKEGVDFKNYIFSNLDADHVLHPKFLSRITYAYLIEADRYNKFFTTSVHLFNNNHWQVSAMARIEANLVTLGTLSQRSFMWSKNSITTDTFACFSAALQTLIDVDYWDVASGVDDTTFYWRAFFKRDGYFRAVKHYIPYSADAVEGESFYRAHKSLYKQLLRWGWGVIEIPIAVKGFLKSKKVDISLKLMWIYHFLKFRIVMRTMVFLITFGFGILTLVNPNVKQSSFAYQLPNIMSLILTSTLIFLIPATYYRYKLAPEVPKNWSLLKKFAVFMESFLIMINLLTFSFFPELEAQTRLMFGKKMKDVYHTPKIRN